MRTGDWLTAERLRGYALILVVASGLLLAFVHATANGVHDYKGRPLGTDFSQVWVAGGSVLHGAPAEPYDNERHRALQKQAFGPEAEFYAWLYPPFFLAPAAALALMPYWPALLLWLSATLAAYLATMRAILPRPGVMVAALAFPAVFINAGHGNNAFLTAALIGGGLAALPARPVLAGLFLGLLAYKPQFGLLLPLALMAGGYWRATSVAVVTVLAGVALTLAAFGIEPWLAFRDSLTFSREVVLEAGGAGYFRLQSAFAAVRLMGGGTGAAYAAQAVVTLAMALAVLRTWRSRVDLRLKAALLIGASLLSTPYLFDYDLVLLAPAGAFFIAYALERGFAQWEKSALAAVALAPLVARNVADWTHIPLGCLSLLAFAALVLRRAESDRRSLLAAAPAGDGKLRHV